MMKYISYTIKETTLDELLVYYTPKVVNKYCESCNKFNKVWSCPPLPFKDLDYVSKYKYCYIISGKIHIDKVPKMELEEIVKHSLSKYSDISKEKDDFSNTFNGLYYSFREFNDKKVSSLEHYFDETISLFSGRCLICNTCTRSIGKPCISEEKLRYSLEGLGFDVTGIIENIVGEKIQWSSDSKPEYVTCVSGLLSNEKLSSHYILELLSE
ncbi:MAG: DUF2284 domain-containing protein [Clostridium sp.]|uniref:DUF2284 domain-containing protein n=1 Tax=Clostridium sp. TaxID=1506 RepID=UPI002FC9D392